MGNKVRYGLKNIHIAPVTVGENNAITFGTPVALPGAVNVEIAPRGETSDFYADNRIFFSGRSASGYDITAEVALVPDWFKKDYLGMVEDDNGVLVESSGNVDAYFAFLFEFTGDECDQTCSVLLQGDSTDALRSNNGRWWSRAGNDHCQHHFNAQTGQQ